MKTSVYTLLKRITQTCVFHLQSISSLGISCSIDMELFGKFRMSNRRASWIDNYCLFGTLGERGTPSVWAEISIYASAPHLKMAKLWTLFLWIPNEVDKVNLPALIRKLIPNWNVILIFSISMIFVWLLQILIFANISSLIF